MTAKPKPPELNWSVFHPTEPDPEVMERTLERADEYGVKNFEMCGDCHGPAGQMDGCLLYEAYPDAGTGRDRDRVMATRDRLNQVVDLIHETGRKVIYWHREVVIPKPVVECAPELVDERGEIDFSGDAYWELIRNKIKEFFSVVPGMDGIVLTLTEADYSVIHNSDPERYPPTEIAARLIRTFAEGLGAAGKSLTFRTFGSIDEDYTALSVAAESALKDCTFEIETKVSPFDWSLVLPPNPCLEKRKNAGLAAEFDLLGEFFGMGEVPCLYPELILEQVKYAIEKGCDRVTGRIDRYGRRCLGSVNEINLLAFSMAVGNPKVTAEEVWHTWAEKHWGPAGPKLIPIMKTSTELIRKSYYIDGHMISQAHPHPIEMMMRGGTVSVFKEGVSLENTADMWSMLSEKTAPTHEAIIREKAEAVVLADAGHKKVKALFHRIPLDQRHAIHNAWARARQTTRMHFAIVKMLVAYFEDMEYGAEIPAVLERAVEVSAAAAVEALRAFPDGIVGEFANQLIETGRRLPEVYDAEFAARAYWQEEPELVDSLVCGGLLDEWRLKRYMHGSGWQILGGRPTRHVGNPVFPDGFLEYVMQADPEADSELIVLLDGSAGSARVTINGTTTVVPPPQTCGLNPAVVPIGRVPGGSVTVRLEREEGFPIVGGLAVRRPL